MIASNQSFSMMINFLVIVFNKNKHGKFRNSRNRTLMDKNVLIVSTSKDEKSSFTSKFRISTIYRFMVEIDSIKKKNISRYIINEMLKYFLIKYIFGIRKCIYVTIRNVSTAIATYLKLLM